MNILKLILILFISITVLTWAAGILSLHNYRESLLESIGKSSISYSSHVLNELDIYIQDKLDVVTRYFGTAQVIEFIETSNYEFSSVSAPDSILNARDHEWRDASHDSMSIFATAIFDNEISHQMHNFVKAHEKINGSKAIGEIFVTNEYGAVIALSAMTSDYRQDDEEWWKYTYSHGKYMSGVLYDASSDVRGLSVCTRMANNEGEFIGVLKMVINIEQMFSIIDIEKTSSSYATTQLSLLGRDGNVIYSTDRNIAHEIGDRELLEQMSNKASGYLLSPDFGFKESRMLLAYTRFAYSSNKMHPPWMMLISHNLGEVLVPLKSLRDYLITFSSIVTAFSLGFLIILYRKIINPVEHITEAADSIRRGNLDQSVVVFANDEIGHLASTFNMMISSLKNSMISIDRLKAEISHRQKVEIALKESEEKYRYMSENVPVVIYTIEFDGNTPHPFMSKRIEDLTGFTKEQFINGNKFYEKLIHESDRDIYFETLQKRNDSGEFIEIEYRITSKNGEIKWIHDEMMIIIDEEGRPVRINGYLEDITKQHQYEHEREKLLHTLRVRVKEFNCLYNISSIIENYQMTLDEMITSMPEIIRQSWQYPDITCVRLMLQDKVYQTDNFQETIWKQAAGIVVRDRLIGSIEVCCIRNLPDCSGDPFLIEERLLLNVISEQLEKVIELKMVENDLRFAKERAEAANIAMNNFITNVSHEIRTPMNAIIGFTEMLLETKLNNDQKDYTVTIKRSGETLLALINDVLDLSKIEAGELEFEELDFDPESIAYEVCEMIIPKIADKPIEILFNVNDSVPMSIRGDPVRFRQVLINLMGNASKFTEAGEIELEIWIEEATDDRLKLHGSIRDTGIGIPEDKQEIIFSQFRQADGSLTRRYGGTGLGLSICKQIVHHCGGLIWVESEIDRGSAFHFTMWFGKSNEAESTTNLWNGYFEGKRALIVDDNNNNLRVLRHYLESTDMRIEASSSGLEALDILKRKASPNEFFDICIIDMYMPVMDGCQLAKEIRNSGINLPPVPVILLSSKTRGDECNNHMQNIDGFLYKPIHRIKLYRMMKELIMGNADHVVPGKDHMAECEAISSCPKEIKNQSKILLAEDNPVNQKLAKILIEKAGYSVTVARNGTEAVEMYTTEPESFDLIFMDIQMPRMDGIEATLIIRDKGHQSIPIIAMTAHAMKGDKERCLEAGMNDYITKPITKERISFVLDKWLLKEVRNECVRAGQAVEPG